jgi:rhodanese-related sulfurtransferase
MNFKKWVVVCMFVPVCLVMTSGPKGNSAELARTGPVLEESSQIAFISAEELKSQMERNQPVTIIDVRSNYGSRGEERKIKGAIHVKLRRLRSRLAFSPLREVTRDQDVVTYCSCPSDEASIRAAEVLIDAGFKRVRVLKGGWVAWLKVNGFLDGSAKGI